MSRLQIHPGWLLFVLLCHVSPIRKLALHCTVPSIYVGYQCSHLLNLRCVVIGIIIVPYHAYQYNHHCIVPVPATVLIALHSLTMFVDARARPLVVGLCVPTFCWACNAEVVGLLALQHHCVVWHIIVVIGVHSACSHCSHWLCCMMCCDYYCSMSCHVQSAVPAIAHH